jgi:hypothetical protein
MTVRRLFPSRSFLDQLEFERARQLLRLSGAGVRLDWNGHRLKNPQLLCRSGTFTALKKGGASHVFPEGHHLRICRFPRRRPNSVGESFRRRCRRRPEQRLSAPLGDVAALTGCSKTDCPPWRANNVHSVGTQSATLLREAASEASGSREARHSINTVTKKHWPQLPCVRS